MKENFFENGFEILSDKDKDKADIYVINSCTVTSMSDKKIRQEIHKLKKINPQSIVVLTGCFPQAFGDEAKKIDGVDIITGSKNRKLIVSLVREFIESKNKIVNLCEYTSKDAFEPMLNK